MALRTAVWAVTKDVPVRSKNTNWSATPRQGAPERKYQTVGKRDGRLYRVFMDFAVDQSDIGILHKAELVFYTDDTEFGVGNQAKVRIYRNTKEFAAGSGANWANTEAVNPSVATGAKWAGAVNQAIDGETRINITSLVGRWLAKSRRYIGDSGVENTGKGYPTNGIRMQAAYKETDWHRGFNMHSQESDNGSLRPFIYIEYEPPNYAPDVISTIEPTGTVLPDQPFSGEFGDPNGDEPAYIKVQVRKASDENVVWNPPNFPFDLSWVDQGATWIWSIENPGSEVLKSDIEYEWRAKGFDGRDKDSGWTGWRTFTQSGTAPTVSPRNIGTRETLVGTFFEADWVVEEAIVSYRVLVRAQGALWTEALWDQTFLPLTQTEVALGHIRFQYKGPALAAGTYGWRVQVVDSRGVSSEWSSVDNFTLTVGSEADLDDGSDALPQNTTGFARSQTKARIVLRDVDGPNRGPGTIKAVIEDAHNVGFSAITNEPGEFFFTLTALHPQAGECEPFQRHYALQLYRNGGWKDVANGILTDFDAGEDDIIIYGLDYLGMLSRSIDTRFPPPGTNLNASHQQGGAKYKDKTISSIVQDQLTEAKNDTDSPTSFFNIGTIQTLSTKVSIYSSFKQRLDFIRGLLESHRQGSGKRTRLKARKDPSQNDRWEWDLRNQPGADRDNLRLEYGSNLQGFRVIAMGEDYATRAHGVGTEPNSVKPRYSVSPSVGSSDFLTQTFGNLQRVEVWGDIVDANDLTRRVKQMRKEASKVGKRIRLAIKVNSLDPFDGYDLTDSIPLDIDRGLVETERYGSGYWTIWGLEWRLFPDGHDELTWAVKPREDDEDPDPDLIPSDPIHDTPEWVLGEGPPPAEPAITAARYYMDTLTGTVYVRPPTADEDDSYGWVEEATIPGVPSYPPGYPGDGAAPSSPTALVVAPIDQLQSDGTLRTVFEATWVDAPEADVIGYEVEWDRTELDETGEPLPADWLSTQSTRIGRGVMEAALSPVIGGVGYEFRVRSYDMEGLQSAWVYHARVVANPDSSAPDIPDMPEAIGGFRLLGVTWSATEASDLSSYEISWRVSGGTDDDWTIVSTKSSRYTISNLENLTEYEVRVRAIDRSGNVRVSGDPESDPPDEVVGNVSDITIGWSPIGMGTTTDIVPEDVAFDDIVAEFIQTGVIRADQVVSGQLLLGNTEAEGVIRIYGPDTEDLPIGAWGDFGWIVADPKNPGRAIHADAGTIRFTSNYQMPDGVGGWQPWDGTDDKTFDEEDRRWTVTRGIEAGIPGTIWTTAIDWRGINAEAITFGSQFGGNNRVLNAGYELQDYDTATLETVEFTDNSDWGSPTSNINTDVSGSELRMASH